MTAVSIITPAHFAEKHIHRPVRSVLAQTHGDWEMIIVSDDEQDYQAVLRAQGITDPRLRFATTTRRGAGPGVARNIGLDMATYPIVAHIDADDAYPPDFFIHMLPLVEKFGAATSAIQMLDEESGQEIWLNDPSPNIAELSLPSMLKYSFAYANILFDRRRVKARWPALMHGEDLVLLVQILDEIPVIGFSPLVKYQYYHRMGSATRQEEYKRNTRALCELRGRMVEWLQQSALRSQRNRDIIMQWLKLHNDIEEHFNYQLAPPAEHKAEMLRRSKDLFEAWSQ
jgi:succinoglycan biosynthesis protein ExoO